MAEHPAQSLPQQMGSPVELRGDYYLLNHPGATLGQLSQQHWEQTRRAASQPTIVVLFIQDTTELDYTKHSTKEVGDRGEDYHQCLKTGCAIEKRQLDHGDDICRLLGFLCPIPV
jgi:hypothetical protein